MTKFQRWASGLTEAQLWHFYVKSDPFAHCPLYCVCSLERTSCGSDDCWHRYKEWAVSSAGENPAEDIGIGEMDLSPRCYNALWRSGIKTLTDVKKRKGELHVIKNFGRKSHDELRLKCVDYGIGLPTWRRMLDGK